ncbi:spermatogenesis-associated protein 7 [Cinclus cinclus]|uniref:spermatogenesis-associated protein 7 n=1 Tax=Cinclus cinclus TaxID=127875 RepID=UPI002E11F328
MGLKTQAGGRRNQGAGGSPVVIPRCGPACPFKGQLSNKSNAFCIDSSRHLPGQYLIRNHMVFHYNRINSAKAAVDSSVPKSRLSSIKFADQQRREKLKKKIGKCEEKPHVCEAVSQCCSRDGRRLLPSSFGKTFMEAEDSHFPCSGQAQYLSRAPSAHGKRCLVHSCPVKCTRKCCRHTSKASHSNSSTCVSRPTVKHAGLSRSRSTESFVTVGCSQRCQGNNPKVSSGDLLERHSECFTKREQPFTPRTLVSDAKSFLSQYRYYTPPRKKKKNHRKQRVEVQTQTDTISFPSADKAYESEVTYEQQKMTSEVEDERDTLDEPERGIGGFQYSSLRKSSWCPQKSSPRSTVDTEEEELLYLTFIEDVTNEILRLGLFSNRVLDQLFESYIEENKNRLDEGKMRQMLDVLKSDLGCGQDSETELIHEGQDALDPQKFDETEELEFTSESHGLRKESEEFRETMDVSLKKPKKCDSLSWSKRSRETRSREESSEDTTETMDAGTECDFCGVEFEEHPDTPPTCEADLNLISCDCGLGVSKELDELEENFAGTLHISRNYS